MALQTLDLGIDDPKKKPESIIKTTENDTGGLDVSFKQPSPEDFEEELLLDDQDDDDDVKWELAEEEQDDELQEEEDEEDEEDDSDDEMVDSEDDSEGKEDEEENEGFEDADEESEEVSHSRGPRENKRIRNLVSEKNELKAKMEKERQDRLALQKQLQELQKATVESNKTLLKDNIETIKGQIKTAMNEGDHDQVIELQSKMSDYQLQLKAQESWKPEEIVEEPQQQQNELPEAFLDWESQGNEWFRNPRNATERQMQQEAVMYANVLEQQGLTVNDEEFYTMVSDRLDKLGLASSNTKRVKSDTTDKKSSKGRKTTQSTKPKNKKISQRVQGGSRTPAKSTRTKKSQENKVTLTPEQISLAETLGITPREYAQEVLKIQRSQQKGNKMTSIFEE
jgi:hypothetical protein